MLLEGLHLPLTTPFFPDGRLNLRKLEFNVDRYSRTPAAGMVVLGSQGEASLLSEDETQQALVSAIGAGAATKVMLAGVSADSLAGTLARAEFAADVRYDAVVVQVPSVLRGAGRAKEIVTYFQMIADRSPLPVVLAGHGLRGEGRHATEIVVELAGHRRIIGLIDVDCGRERVTALKAGTDKVSHEVTVTTVFSAVTDRMLRDHGSDQGGSLLTAETLAGGRPAVATAPGKLALRTRTKTVGFQILAGDSLGMLEGLQAGAVGAVPGFGACAPQVCYEVLAAWKDGDAALAKEKQIRVTSAAERIERGIGVAGVKYGCDLTGYFGGLPRLPWLPITGAERAEVEALMQGMRS
jgi:dihydrodipicolinate synthase/N-acetylneuraminate lyase